MCILKVRLSRCLKHKVPTYTHTPGTRLCKHPVIFISFNVEIYKLYSFSISSFGESNCSILFSLPVAVTVHLQSPKRFNTAKNALDFISRRSVKQIALGRKADHISWAYLPLQTAHSLDCPRVHTGLCRPPPCCLGWGLLAQGC